MTASTSLRSTRPRRMPRTPVAIRAAGKDKNVMQARFRNIVRRMSTPTAIFFAVNPPPRPIASTRVARSEERDRSMSSTLRRCRSLFRIPREREAGEIVALGQNVLCLPEQRPDLRRVQVVRLSFLEDRFACDENRSSFLDLRLAKLDRPFNLLLLALHREPFGPLE